MRKLIIAVCAVAVGVAFAWASAFAADTQATTDRAESKTERMKDKAADKADEAKEKGQSVMDKTKEKAREVKEKISEKLHRGKEKIASKKAGDARADVRSAQQALRDQGYNPGPVDGVMGPKTKAAISDYQKAQDLPVTGRLDDATTAKLGVGAHASATDINRGSQGESTTPSASPATATPPPAATPPATK